ncbi:MAG: VOC family protein [Candidatus Binatia bacterium]
MDSMTTEILVNIDVDDLEKAIAFYQKAVGLRLGRRLFGDNVAELLGASAKIYLLAKPGGTPGSSSLTQRRDYQRHWTPVHLDFVVTEIQAAVKRAKTAGAQLEGEVQTYDWGHTANMADPFGHGFCLLEFTGRDYNEAGS